MSGRILDFRDAALSAGPAKPQSIELPRLSLPSSHMSLDLGGSLAKLVYFRPSDQEQGGALHCRCWEISDLQSCLTFCRENVNITGPIPCSGGGAYKFSSTVEEALGQNLIKKDEMVCLITGLNFLLLNIPFESFTYTPAPATVVTPLPPQLSPSSIPAQPVVNERHYIAGNESPFPYLLVNIGSGVSVLRVDSESSYERVSGSSLGGGTFVGLCKLLTPYNTYTEMLKASEEGDNSSVDMLVGDIYGHDYSAVGLSAETIASSFGKATRDSGPERRPQDICRALLYMICNNIAQVAFMNAQRYNLTRVYFGGYFIADHPPIMDSITFGVNFWSKGQMRATFLRHEGYLGAIGAFLKSGDATVLTGSSAPPSPTGSPVSSRAPAFSPRAMVRAASAKRAAAPVVDSPHSSSSSGSSSPHGDAAPTSRVDSPKRHKPA